MWDEEEEKRKSVGRHLAICFYFLMYVCKSLNKFPFCASPTLSHHRRDPLKSRPICPSRATLYTEWGFSCMYLVGPYIARWWGEKRLMRQRSSSQWELVRSCSYQLWLTLLLKPLLIVSQGKSHTRF